MEIIIRESFGSGVDTTLLFLKIAMAFVGLILFWTLVFWALSFITKIDLCENKYYVIIGVVTILIFASSYFAVKYIENTNPKQYSLIVNGEVLQTTEDESVVEKWKKMKEKVQSEKYKDLFETIEKQLDK